MDCKKVTGFFASELSGDISERESSLLKEHLVTCQSCKKEWLCYKKTWDLIGIPAPDLPNASAARIFSELEQTVTSNETEGKRLPQMEEGIGQKCSKRAIFFSVTAVSAVAAIFVVAILWRVFSPRPPVEKIDGTVIVTDGRVVTKADQRGIVKVFNRSLVELEPHSELIAENDLGQHVVKFAQGSVTVDVEKRPEPFQVKTPLADIDVLGTKFKVVIESFKGEDMKALKKMLKVIVLAGMVQVANPKGMVTAGANETVLVNQDEKPIKQDKQETRIVCSACIKEYGEYLCHFASEKCLSCGTKAEIICSKDHKIAHRKHCVECVKKLGICAVCGKAEKTVASWEDLICKKHLKDKKGLVHTSFKGVCKRDKDHKIKNPIEGECEDLHSILELVYCLDCAKKDSLCPVCGEKIKNGNIDDKDKKWIKGVCKCQKGEISKCFCKDKGLSCTRCKVNKVRCEHESLCTKCVKELGVCFQCHGKLDKQDDIDKKWIKGVCPTGGECKKSYSCACAFKGDGVPCERCHVTKLRCKHVMPCAKCVSELGICGVCHGKIGKKQDDGKWIKEKCSCPADKVDEECGCDGRLLPCARCKLKDVSCPHDTLCGKCTKELGICHRCHGKK